MRRTLLAFALGCLLTAARADAAGGVALRWDHCYGEGTVAANRSFACDTNSGTEVLVGSFILPINVTFVVGNDIAVDFTTSGLGAFLGIPPSGPPLPQWWKYFQAGTCRQTALSATFFADPADVACEDWGSQEVGAIGGFQIETPGTLGPGRARLIMGVAVSQDVDLFAGREFVSFTLRIRHDKTVGAGACGGCEVPLHVFINSIHIVTKVAANDLVLTNPVNGSDANIVSWNAGTVPTRGASWTALKRQYR